jgi:hypothetical protein
MSTKQPGSTDNVENPVYRVLRLDPWRIELYDLLNQLNIKGDASMRSNEERVWPVQAFHSRFALHCVHLVFSPRRAKKPDAKRGESK